MPTEFMPDRSFEKFVRNPDSDAVLLPPIELTRFAKLCCSESTEPALLEVPALAPVVLLAAAVELLPLTSEMRLCSAELSGPPPKPPAGGAGMPRGVLVAAVPLVELVPAAVLSAVVAPVPLLLPVAEPVVCACSDSTRFLMKASIASCGVVVPEVDALEELLEAESVAALEAVVVVPPVAAVAAELAVVTAPESVSACMSTASRPPAGGACAAP